MDNFTIENVLLDVANGIHAGGVEGVSEVYNFETDDNGILKYDDGKLTIIAPTGQRFVVTVVEEK